MPEHAKPPRSLIQMPRFERTKRRLPPAAQLATDGAIKQVLGDPLSGESKIGALRGMRVVKFKVGPLLLLLAYKFDPRRNVVEAWAVGPHENFYRELQKYLDAR